MTRTVVTVVAVAAWVLAVILIVRLRDRTASSSALEPAASIHGRLRVLASRGAGGLAGAIVAGVLVMGLGGRLMMRLLAATSSESVQGAITDMEAVVGRVTVGGTVGFVLFVGAGAGVIGWLLRLVCRRWLPTRSVVAGLVGAGIGAGLLARPSSLLDPSNRDFVILTPDWLAVVLILGLIVTFGVLLAVLSDRWAQWWPTPRGPLTWLWLAPLAPLLMLPPIAVGVSAAAGVRAGLGPIDRFRWSTPVDRIGYIVVPIAGIIGGVATLAAALEILRA